MIKSRDYYTAPRLTSEQAGQYTSWEFPTIAKRLGLENKNLLPTDFDRDRKELERHIEAAKKLGFEEGFKQGQLAGHQAGLVPLTEKAQILSSLLLGFEVGVKGLDHVFEEQILALAMEIAKAIVRQELTVNPQHVRQVVQEAINELPKNAAGIKLHLNPADIELLKENLATEVLPDLTKITFVTDPALTRGGCILEADESYINASLAARLDAVWAIVNDTTNN